MSLTCPSRALVPAAHSLLPRSIILTRLRVPASLRRHCAGSPLPQLRHRSMGAARSALAPATSAEDDARFGFRRAEMYKSSLSNTVDAYDRHVFVCFKGPEAWAPRVEESEAAVLPKLLSSAIKARKNDTTVKTKLTVFGEDEGLGCSNGDVLIFPDMIRYKGLLESDVDSFVDDLFTKGRPWASGVSEVLTGSYIFVCTHGSRDRRCGVCGPPLIEKLNEEIESRGLKGRVLASPCSHIGGHKYAGNLIIYSPDEEGKINGHWYGYVTPDDVPDLLDQHITKGLVIERLWRGQMRTSSKESEKPQASTGSTVKEGSFTCCQGGANGSSCGADKK